MSFVNLWKSVFIFDFERPRVDNEIPILYNILNK